MWTASGSSTTTSKCRRKQAKDPLAPNNGGTGELPCRVDESKPMKIFRSCSLYVFAILGAFLASSNAAQPNQPQAHKSTPAKAPVPTQAQMQKVFPNHSEDVFTKGRQVTVFWIEHAGPSEHENDFHGYHIRGQHTVTSAVLQERLKSGIEEAIATDPGSGARCFHPVHGLRVSEGTQSVDLVICFGCRRLVVFSGQSQSSSTLGKSGDTEFLLNRVLRGSIQ